MQKSREMVEWDFTHAVVLHVKDDHGDPHSTGIPKRPDSRTRWMDVYVEFPDDYLPNLPQLLGPGAYDLRDEATLVKYFPHADYSIESVRAALKDLINGEARAALGATDFYLVRQIETGEEPPAEIKAGRAQVRKTVADTKAKIDKATPAELATIEWDLRAPLPPMHRPQVSIPDVVPPPDAPGQPGDNPSRAVGEPEQLDPALTDAPPPGIDGAPIEETS